MPKLLTRLWPIALLLLLPATAQGQAGREAMFEDPLFRKCIAWLLDGQQGGMIENRCIDNYSLPTPSLFLCSRKILTGFKSPLDQEGCAVLFEDQAAKVRAGYVK